MRRRLVQHLREKGIQDENLLTVIEQLPRHFFMEKGFEDIAYDDRAFPIAADQTISQPYTVAYQTQLLEVKKREKVLEVGTGSGYQASILALLGARVYTVERHEILHKKSKAMFELLQLNIRAYFKDGYKGLPEHAPFDKILVTAGASSIPIALKEQLKVGGILVIPVGDDSAQKMVKLTRVSEKKFELKSYDNFRFVPFIEGLSKNSK